MYLSSWFNLTFLLNRLHYQEGKINNNKNSLKIVKIKCLK